MNASVVKLVRHEALAATGESVKGRQAFAIGLVDAIVDEPLRAAIAQARGVSKRRLSAATVPKMA
ncbi:hypothetical protein AS026_03815 [Rhizobium altiplani]|uniref:Uncharacterized protein n=1 Tax=Rhizobium altiplani TaxID=1864509 RepID=A0A109JQ34_9HYPH|nr:MULTISPECIES: hypothetical protein [Rhizobium]KWV53011.1 hypothetical protein AS026_03815 [Rhizobium altiplani]